MYTVLEHSFGTQGHVAPSSKPESLSTLSNSQFIDASAFLILDLTHPNLKEFVEPGNWFFDLEDDQRKQVIEHYRTQPIAGMYGRELILTWYEQYGPRGAFRYEIAFTSPVVTR